MTIDLQAMAFIVTYIYQYIQVTNDNRFISHGLSEPFKSTILHFYQYILVPNDYRFTSYGLS